MEQEGLEEVVMEDMEEGLAGSTLERHRKLQKEVQGELFFLMPELEQGLYLEVLEHLYILRLGFLAGRLGEQGRRLPKCQVWAYLDSTKEG